MPCACSLIALARDDSNARGQLLEGYRPYLTLLARVQIGRQLRGKADPDDLVQETFLLAHREFATFRGQTEPELTAWLRRILARIASGELTAPPGIVARLDGASTALEAAGKRSSRQRRP